MTREESFAEADRRLAAAYQQYTLEELRWDWRSKISERSREILKAELVRRKVPMDFFDSLGRGKRRKS